MGLLDTADTSKLSYGNSIAANFVIFGMYLVDCSQGQIACWCSTPNVGRNGKNANANGNAERNKRGPAGAQKRNGWGRQIACKSMV